MASPAALVSIKNLRHVVIASLAEPRSLTP